MWLLHFKDPAMVRVTSQVLAKAYIIIHRNRLLSKEARDFTMRENFIKPMYLEIQKKKR